MARLPIVLAPDPRLRRVSLPVREISDDIRRLMDDMVETMYAADGLGLSAIQVDVPLRIVVMDLSSRDEPPSPVRMVNPELVWQSPELREEEEGCLSLPDQYARVVRPARIRARWLDATGARQEGEGGGMLATCLQHEIDHMDGKLFVDHISRLRRDLILRRLRRRARGGK